MAQFTVNTDRLDPYANFKFRVQLEGKFVAGVSKVSALKRTTEVIEHRDGADFSSSRKSPGRSKYEAVTLERGLTHDEDFNNWAKRVWNYEGASGAESSLADYKRDLTIVLYNFAGQKVMAYNLYRCWVSEYQAVPELDANANAVAIESIKLELEGFARDTSVTEPTEPSLGF